MLDVDKKETIICAAIWYKNPVLKNPEVMEIRGFRPRNADSGLVVCGWRHPNCMYLMNAIYGIKDHEQGEAVDGFLTNTNRFVDRAEGAKIHIANGGTLKYSDILYSEDLY